MRKKKALLNIASSGLYQIISIVCGLIVPRLILKQYGSTYNGVYVSLTQILGIISILTLGIAGATRVELYKTLASNDILGTSRIIKATTIYMRKVGLALLFYTIVLLVCYPYVSHNDLTFWENDLLIIIVACSLFGEYYFAASNKMLLMSDQTNYVVQNIYSGARIAETLLTVLFVWIGYSIYCVKGMSSFVFILAALILNIYVAKKYSLIKDCEPDYTGIKNRKAAMYHSVANMVHNNSNVVILTLFADAKVLSVYSVYYLVLGKAKSIMQIFTNGLEAAFGNMWANGEIKTLRKRFFMCEHGMYCFVCVVFCCIGVLILPFIRLYTAGVTDIKYTILSFAILATLTEASYCIRQPYVILVQAAGKYEETKKGAALEAIINIIIALLLVKPMGINGVIIGTLVANVFRTVQYEIFASKHILQVSLTKMYLKFGWTLFTSICTLSLCLLVIRIMPPASSWIIWIYTAVTVFFISGFVVLFMSLFFYKHEIEQFLSLITRKTAKSKA